jgi:hypothetical protein
MLGGCPSWDRLAEDALTACIRAEKFNHGQHAQIRQLTPRMKLSIARAVEAEHSLGEMDVLFVVLLFAFDLLLAADGQQVILDGDFDVLALESRQFDRDLDLLVVLGYVEPNMLVSGRDSALRSRNGTNDLNAMTYLLRIVCGGFVGAHSTRPRR